MSEQNLIIVEDVNEVTINPSLYLDNYQTIGVFGENGRSNTTFLKNLVTQAIHLGLPVFGINLSKILDSRFYEWETETLIESVKVNRDFWEVDDNSDKGSIWISDLAAESLQFDKSVLFINNCTPLLKNPKVSQYLGNLCTNSRKYGLQVILTAKSSHVGSQKIIKNLGNQFVVLSQFNPTN